MKTMRLGEICRIQSGGTPSRKKDEFWKGDIPWAKISDLEKSGTGYISQTEEKISDSGLAAIRHRIFEPGTLLFAMYGSVGKTAVAECKISANQAILGINPISDDLDLLYLQYWLESQRTKFETDARGVAQKNLSAGYVRDLEINLPPLSEQKRIATILDKADSLRRKRQQAIELAEQYLRSVFLEMFNSAKIAEWKHSTVDGVARREKGSMRTGPFGSQLLHSEFTAEGIPVLGIDNVVTNTFRWAKPRFISEEKYSQLRRYTVQPNDVLISIMGTCGRCAVVPEEFPVAINTKHLCCITLDQSLCLPDFLHAYFLYHPSAREYLSKNSKGAIMDGLNMSIIRELPVPLAPLDLQLKYSKLKAAVENVTIKQSEALLQAEGLFSSLAQRAFS